MKGVVADNCGMEPGIEAVEKTEDGSRISMEGDQFLILETENI